MAARTPLTRLTLGAASVADDLGYDGLSDLARALGDIPADFRVIGGHMVTVLAARWRLGRELYRETGDVDLGITPIVARDRHVVSRVPRPSLMSWSRPTQAGRVRTSRSEMICSPPSVVSRY